MSDSALPISVRGVPHQHPAYRRLARACIAIVRERLQRTEVEPADDHAQPAVVVDDREAGHA